MRFRIVGGLSLPDWVIFAVSKLRNNFKSKQDYIQLVDCSKDLLLGKAVEKNISIAAVALLLQSTIKFDANEALSYELRLLGAS